MSRECVHLCQGDFNQTTAYSKRPASIAKAFAEAGARRLHIIDLDSVRGNSANNRDVIREIRDTVPCVLQVGGGIREEEDVKELIDIGVEKLILGTLLINNPETVSAWVRQYGDIFIGGIDAREGMVKIDGRVSSTFLKDLEVLDTIKNLGITQLIYTNISRDGTMEGPDIDRANLIAQRSGMEVIIAGGISSEQDIEEIVTHRHKNLIGLIVGKAIYENRISLSAVFREYS
ncbi:MAG: 1-(5-phosphoribosyl)-5-((5-phosphoribosylamino)methylideneamino)imidazole-4-carboxamide isomerase [Spirochaetales bacterium]|nr:1-(5-phosphoribosyl)-5-((5-phosphoribosylamino)methylideneamino)imidazole-4-carboxamide isomerase [Spirochaetales bacterium]